MRKMSDEEQREWLRQAVINDARMLIQRRGHLKDISDKAQNVFDALVDADTWHLNKGPEPTKDWTEPEEIWHLTPKVTRK